MNETQELTENAKDFPIWKLTYLLANMERRVFELKKAGESCNKNPLSRIICKRNIYRKELLKKLLDWKKHPEKYSVTFADTINSVKQV